MKEIFILKLFSKRACNNIWNFSTCVFYRCFVEGTLWKSAVLRSRLRKIGRTIYSPEIPIRESVSEADYLNNSGTSIGHFYEKKLKLLELINTEEAKKIAKRRTDYILEYLKEFFDEWEGKI